MLSYKNNNLICKDGDPMAADFEKKRSYCYYNGNCMSLGLESLIFTTPEGWEFEITKSQYLFQHFEPFRCEIMLQALPDIYMKE